MEMFVNGSQMEAAVDPRIRLLHSAYGSKSTDDVLGGNCLHWDDARVGAESERRFEAGNLCFELHPVQREGTALVTSYVITARHARARYKTAPGFLTERASRGSSASGVRSLGHAAQ